MKRYFDLPEARQTLQIEVNVASNAALAPPERVRKHFKLPGSIREIERTEYLALRKKYTEIEAAASCAVKEY